MSAAANKAVVHRYFEECWNKGDLTVVDEEFGPQMDRDWVRDAITRWLIAFPDFQYHVDCLIAEGDIVAASTRFTATHRGVFHHGSSGPWPPTGKPIDVREMLFFRFAEGKVAELRWVFDKVTWARQLGVELP